MKLSETEFKATAAVPMKRLGPDAEPPLDFWAYFEAIPEADFEGHDCSAGDVTYVWEHPEGRYQHVLIDSADGNVFMALVLDAAEKRVVGHHLLDLRPLAATRRAAPAD